jgi:hypothetical protein
VLNAFHRYSALLVAVVVIMSWSSGVAAQQASPSAPQSEDRQTVGTVNSIGRGSIVVKGDEGQFMVFAVNRGLVGIPTLSPGDRVRVTTARNDDDEAPTALAIAKLPPREGLAPQNPQSDDPVPTSVRNLSSQIEKQARKYRAGVFGGAALDPELISINAFTTLAPFRSPRLAVRPNLEFAFGEVTTLLGLHFDVLYSLPGMRATARWAPYFGAGPSFFFSHRSIDEEEFITGDLPPGTTPTEEEESRFDFSQWDWDNGFNFIVGARNPNGTFFELKGTAYGVSSIRMLGGFEF